MNTPKHVVLIASFVASLFAMPALAFAQQTNAPSSGTMAAPAASTQMSPANASTRLDQQPSHRMSNPNDASGYGAPISGSTQSSTMHFVGKHSRVFDH